MKDGKSFALVTGLSTLITFPLSAATVNWLGEGADANWLTSGNWQDVLTPAEFDTLAFGPNGAGLNGATLSNDFTTNTQFNGILFSGSTGFTLTGNTIDLGGDVDLNSTVNQTINLGLNLVQNAAFDVDTSRTLTVNGLISGAFDLTKTGTGLLVLGGANNYSGTTYIQGGTLQISQNGSVDPAGLFVLGGPTSSSTSILDVRGLGNDTKSIGGLDLLPSTVGVSTTRTGGSGIFTADLNAITRSNGGVVNFTVNANTAIHTTNTNTNDILGAWATIGSNYAAVDVDGNIVAYTGGTDLAGPTPVIASDATANLIISDTSTVALTGGATTTGSALVTVDDTSNLVEGAYITGTGIPYGATVLTVDSGTQITISANASADGSGLSFTGANTVTIGSSLTELNTLQYTSNGNRLIDLGGNTLRLGAEGGVWRTSTTSIDNTPGNLGLKINNGTLTAGGADNSDGEIIFNASGANNRDSRANRSIMVGANITDNGSGVVTVTKTGDSALELSGTNTYTGGTYLNQGRLYTTNGSALGEGDIHVIGNNSQLVLAGGLYNNDVYIAGVGLDAEHGHPTSVSSTAGALILNNGSELAGTLTLVGDTRISGATAYQGNTDNNGLISGQITGDYALQIGNFGNIDFGMVTISNPDNDWTGGLSFALNATSGSRESLLRLGDSEVIPHGVGFGDVTISSNGSTGNVGIRLNGFDETINGLYSGGSQPTYGQITNTSATAATLTIGAGDADGSYTGRLQNGTGGGALSIRKIGQGTQEIAGTIYSTNSVANSYTGTTTVDGGTLLVSGTLTGTSGIFINAGSLIYTNDASMDRAVTVDGGEFKYLSIGDFSGTITLNSGTLGGTNWNGMGDLVIGNNVSISPGNSPGQAVGVDQTWADGGNYQFEINDATGASGVNWDDVNFTGDLDLSGLTAGGFTIALISLDGSNESGIVANFDQNTEYSWEFASYGTITGTFLSSLFAIDDSAFQNSYSGSFSVSQVGNSLFVNYSVPEPSTYALLLGIIVSLAALRRRRS